MAARAVAVLADVSFARYQYGGIPKSAVYDKHGQTMKPEVLTDLTLRPATPADALAIIVTRAPAQVSPEQLQSLARQIELGEESFVVAVDRRGEVIAYGSIYCKESNLRALYVKPPFGRRGIGRLMLTHLETLARNAGVTELTVDATIRAMAFYARNGFIEQTWCERMSTPWYTMACLPMQKALQPQPQKTASIQRSEAY